MGASALVSYKVYKKHKERDSIIQLSTVVYFLLKIWTFAASISSVDVAEVDKSLPKLETSISVLADSVNKDNISKFLLPKLLVHHPETR